MKSATEKLFPLFLLAAVLFASAGCAPVTPRDRVEEALDADGELYIVSDSTALLREGADWYGEIERRVAESESPQRDAIQYYLTAFKTLCRFAGTGNIEVFGMSSHRETDGSYLNRCAAAGPADAPWPWDLGGAPGDRLDDLKKLPGDTLAAASFTVDTAAAATELRRAGAEKLLEYKPALLLGFSIGEVLSVVSGSWQMAVLPPPHSGDGAPDWSQGDFYLSCPDRGGAHYRRISAILPPAGDGMLRMPASGKISPLVIGADGMIRLYSTPECRTKLASPKRTLGDEARFAAAAEKLPNTSNGAFYFSDDGVSVGVWKFQPGLVELSAYSTRGTATLALRRLLLAPLSLVIDQALARPPKQPEMKNKPPVPEQRSALPPPELMKKRRTALADAMSYLNAQRKKSGRFPAELPEKYSHLVWFGAPQGGRSGKLPLIVEAPDRKRPWIGVLFADGTIEFFDFPAASLKHLCSFLHTRYHYDEKEFVRLIRRASELDAHKKGAANERPSAKSD